MFKRLFILCGVLFFLAEPFVINAGRFVVSAPQSQKTCPVCGMVEVCGEVCCCVKNDGCHGVSDGSRVSILKTACHNENPFAQDGSPEVVKCLPNRALLFSPSGVFRGLSLNPNKNISFFAPPASPPPKNA